MYTTPRLLLRPWTDADLEPFAWMNADPAVMEHFPSRLTRDESDAVAGRIRAQQEERGFGLWAVGEREEVIRGAAAFVGFIGLHAPTFEAPFTPCVEVGWRIARAHWGKGYATEGAKEALRVGFVDYLLPEIVSMTVPANVRSRRVMEKIGMTRDPGGDFDHPKVPRDSPLVRHVLYRLTRAAYFDVR